MAIPAEYQRDSADSSSADVSYDAEGAGGGDSPSNKINICTD
jgi:hypothetical protein